MSEFFLPSIVPPRDDNGAILEGATWAFRARNTTTPRATTAGFSIISDANGAFDFAYRTEGLDYRAVLNDAEGSVITDITLADDNYFSAGSQQALVGGLPVHGATWSFYATGTTTPRPVYADPERTTTLGSVVTANAAGRFPEVYLDPSITYKAVLASPAATLDTIDPVDYSGMLQFLKPNPGWTGTTRRGISTILDAEEPLSGIPNQVVLEKLRTDFIEFAVYSPLDSDGIKWVRHFSSVRLYSGNQGAPDYQVGTLALLYASTTLALFGSTGTNSITADTPTATVEGASATSRTGTWTGPVSVFTMPNAYHTSTTGDTVVYDIAVPAGGVIYHEAPGVTGNGGIAEVKVELSAVEITAAEYLCPLSSGVRIADYRYPNAGLAVIPLAKVTTGGTYTVTLTRSAQSPAGGRLYDIRVRAYNATPYNSAGVYGSTIASGDGGITSDLTYAAGSTFVYQCLNTTRITFAYWANPTAGQVKFTVYDNSGVEVGSYITETVDMYSASSPGASTTVEVVRGLAKGTYWLHAQVLSTKNASATGYRMYVRKVRTFDETTAGTLGVDEFDILDMPLSPGADFGTHCFSGFGNHWYATQWRPAAATSWPSGDNFVSGVHGEETALTNADLTFNVDGVEVDYDGAAQYATFTGASIVLTFSTTIKFPGTATNFGTLARTITYTKGTEIKVETVRTLTSEATYGNDYIMMLQAANGGGSQSSNIGGGFGNWALERDGNLTLNASNNSSVESDPWSECYACWNTQYASYVQLENPEQVQVQYEDYLVDTNNILAVDNSTDLAKIYLRSAGAAQYTTGVTLSAGHVSRVVKRYRTVPTTNAGTLLAV